MNQNEEDFVSEIVGDFITDEMLFTALDVSNEVKKTFPMLRHREIRDVVRSIFNAEIEPRGYARTPINVTLANGSTVEALLYHPLGDSWDLDVKYGSDRRASEPVGFVKFGDPAPIVPVPAAVVPLIAPIPPAPTLSNLEAWSNLLKSLPSLFK